MRPLPSLPLPAVAAGLTPPERRAAYAAGMADLATREPFAAERITQHALRALSTAPRTFALHKPPLGKGPR